MVEKSSRVAAIYDVHANLPALEAVLADLKSVDPDLIVVGGDVVAGPMPAEVLERLEALDERICFVRATPIVRLSQLTMRDATKTLPSM
jgi:Icc-related predicted phosphoesterase